MDVGRWYIGGMSLNSYVGGRIPLSLLNSWADIALDEPPDQFFGHEMREATIRAQSSTDVQMPRPNSAGPVPSPSEADVPVVPTSNEGDKEPGM